MPLPEDSIEEIEIPEFTAAIAAFSSAGLSFTGVRHGTVVEGRSMT